MFIQTLIDFFRQRLYNKVKILYSSRGKIEYTADSNKDSDWVGPNGEFLVQILTKIFSKRENKDIKTKVVEWASKFVL
jgi:hypothetical protein